MCVYIIYGGQAFETSLKQINNTYTHIYVCIFICTKQRTTSLFLFVNKQLCYSRQNKNFSINNVVCKIFFFQVSDIFKTRMYFNTTAHHCIQAGEILLKNNAVLLLITTEMSSRFVGTIE